MCLRGCVFVSSWSCLRGPDDASRRGQHSSRSTSPAPPPGRPGQGFGGLVGTFSHHTPVNDRSHVHISHADVECAHGVTESSPCAVTHCTATREIARCTHGTRVALQWVFTELRTMNTQRTCSPCPQCGSTNAHLTLLSSDRHQCNCRACGFSWIEPWIEPSPPALRPMKDRRKAPHSEYPE